MQDSSPQHRAGHSCALCGKEATNFCGACQNTHDLGTGKSSSTWYCGLQCQKCDWSQHKALCKASVARKVLYRAADTAQAMFYVFREIAFNKLIVKVERAKGELRLFEGLYQDEILVPFPASLIKDENEKKAVLTYLACGDACGYMDIAIKTMLGGISSRLSEISIKPRIKKPLKLRMFDALKEDRNDYQHEALVVRLKDGSSFVVDLAGPQFGYHLPVMPYDNYIKTMVRDKSSPTKQPFGYQRAEMVKGCSTKLYLDPRYSSNTDIRIVTEQLYRIFNDCLESWQSRKMPLTAMLKLKEKEYLEYQKDLLATVKQVLLDGRSRIETFSNGVPKSPSRIPVPPKTKERTFEEHKAELLQSALANGHAVWDLSGLKF